jgi:hypothetical protein
MSTDQSIFGRIATNLHYCSQQVEVDSWYNSDLCLSCKEDFSERGYPEAWQLHVLVEHENKRNEIPMHMRGLADINASLKVLISYVKDMEEAERFADLAGKCLKESGINVVSPRPTYLLILGLKMSQKLAIKKADIKTFIDSFANYEFDQSGTYKRLDSLSFA